MNEIFNYLIFKKELKNWEKFVFHKEKTEFRTHWEFCAKSNLLNLSCWNEFWFSQFWWVVEISLSMPTGSFIMKMHCPCINILGYISQRRKLEEFININYNTKSLWRSSITPLQKQPPEVFYKKAALEIFTIFIGKHLCWGFFLITLQALRPPTSIKSKPNTDFSLWIQENFKGHLLWRNMFFGLMVTPFGLMVTRFFYSLQYLSLKSAIIKNHGISWINFDLFIIDELSPAKIPSKIMRCSD